jgi:hypothetical protein
MAKKPTQGKGVKAAKTTNPDTSPAVGLTVMTRNEMFTRHNTAKLATARETLEITMKYRNLNMARGVVITCLSLALVGCGGTTQLLQGGTGQQVTVKASDPTPPSGITLETHGRPGGEVTLGIGAPSLAIIIGRGDSYFLRAIAEDPDGIKQVAIWGTTEKTCEDPATGIAQLTGPGLVGAPLVQDMSAATVGGAASTGRYVSYVVKVDIQCPATAPRFVSQKLVFWGEATNFSNLRTKGPWLTITAK